MATRFHTTPFIEFTEPGLRSFSHDFRNRVRDAGAFIQGFDITAQPRLRVGRLQVAVQNVQASGTTVSGEVIFDFHNNENRSGAANVFVGIAADVED